MREAVAKMEKIDVETDESLMARFQRGDVRAFERLVERYQKRAVSVAFQYVHNLEEAKDLAQDTFVKLFQARQTFREGERFAPWFFRILVNHSVNLYRRKKLVHFFSIFQNENDETRTNLLETLSDTQDAEEENDRRALVHHAISRLPEKYRSVVILRDIEGFSEEETGRILGIPKGTVKSRLFHARRKLKRVLERELRPI